MTRLDYGSYYRFLVSVGVAIIALGLLLPWLVLSESFDLYLTTQQLSDLSEVARSTVRLRQEQAAFLVNAVWPASLLLTAGGLAVVVGGLRKWRTRQSADDAEVELRTEKLRQEIRAMSPTEVERKLELEVAATDPPEGPAGAPGASLVAVFRDAEMAIGHALSRCLGGLGEHIVLLNRQHGAAQYDAIIQDRSGDGTDIVVEIKLMTKNFHFGWLSEAAHRLALSVQIYREFGPARGLLLVAVPPAMLREARLDRYVSRLQSEWGLGEPELRISFVDNSRLEDLDCTVVGSWVHGLLGSSSA